MQRKRCLTVQLDSVTMSSANEHDRVFSYANLIPDTFSALGQGRQYQRRH